MRAIQVTRLDGPEAVELQEVPDPEPGEGQVLIEVHAAGVAFPDVLQTRGLYQAKPPLPFAPGGEVAGIVLEAPAGCGFAPGDRVAGMMMIGGFAEKAAVPVESVYALPDRLTWEQGASIVLNYTTAHFALLDRGRFTPGESVLVQGAAGGVGTASIQVAKAFGASRVIAVTSTDEKGAAALEAGADEYVLLEGFKDVVKASGGVDIVVDPVGGDRFTDSLRCLVPDGRLLVIGFTAGTIPSVQVNRLLLNNIDVVGVSLGGYNAKRPHHSQDSWKALLPHVESGALSPLVGSVRPLAEAGQAMTDLDERRAIGKLVLTVR